MPLPPTLYVHHSASSNQGIRHLSQLFSEPSSIFLRTENGCNTYGHCPCSISGSDLRLFISSIHVKSRRHRGWYFSHKSAARFHDGQLSSFLQMLSIQHQNKEDHLCSKCSSQPRRENPESGLIELASSLIPAHQYVDANDYTRKFRLKTFLQILST